MDAQSSDSLLYSALILGLFVCKSMMIILLVVGVPSFLASVIHVFIVRKQMYVISGCIRVSLIMMNMFVMTFFFGYSFEFCAFIGRFCLANASKEKKIHVKS